VIHSEAGFSYGIYGVVNSIYLMYGIVSYVRLRFGAQNIFSSVASRVRSSSDNLRFRHASASRAGTEFETGRHGIPVPIVSEVAQ